MSEKSLVGKEHRWPGRYPSKEGQAQGGAFTCKVTSNMLLRILGTPNNIFLISFRSSVDLNVGAGAEAQSTE